MKAYLLDPTVLIPVGLILVGLVLLFWAIGRLIKKTPDADPGLLGDASLSTGSNERFNSNRAAEPEPAGSSFKEFSISSFMKSKSASSTKETPPPSSVANKEMAERLDTMSQRLTDMQSVLQRQATAAPAGAPLTPETIDKLLRIISNVTQQVDLLQRSLGSAPTAPSPTSAQPVGQTTGQKPAAASPTPSSTPTVGKPGSKTIGVVGGALSRQVPPPTPAEAPASGGPPPAGNLNPPAGK